MSITDELRLFILAQKNVDYGDRYWLSVIKGIGFMMQLRDALGDKNLFMEKFHNLRERLLTETSDQYIEDLVDELNAILIQYYPMPDFWNATMMDFKNHVNFKRHFDLLDNQERGLT